MQRPTPAYPPPNAGAGRARLQACGSLWDGAVPGPCEFGSLMGEGNVDVKGAIQAWLADPAEAERKYGHISDWDVSRATMMTFLSAIPPGVPRPGMQSRTHRVQVFYWFS